MTEKEYQDLIKTYGEDMAKQLIEQLSLYKQSKGKITKMIMQLYSIGLLKELEN